MAFENEISLKQGVLPCHTWHSDQVLKFFSRKYGQGSQKTDKILVTRHIFDTKPWQDGLQGQNTAYESCQALQNWYFDQVWTL